MRTLICLVAALGLACEASAATVTVDSDKATYLPGETITITTTLTTTGSDEASDLAVLELLWSDPQIAGVPGPAEHGPPLTSFQAMFAWAVGSGNCLSASCLVIDQVNPLGGPPNAPNATVNVGTLTMITDGVGTLNFGFGFTSVFGATPTMGANMKAARIVPEPGTAALLGLGLTVLAMRRRQPN